MAKELTESLEKYLLAICELLREQKSIKVKDVSSYLKIGGPATADAIKTLAARGFINYVPYGTISVTAKGASAIEIKRYRRNTISKFLNMVLDIPEKEAEKNAIAIEYSMTEDVLTKFVHFLDFMGQCSCKEPKWIKSCKSTLQDGKLSKKCQACGAEGRGCGCCGK
ncbi:MAG: metal-dependent transcriptional regulator [bacterium]|nr:metal-dependent transcriptional regulator [bacterium]